VVVLGRDAPADDGPTCRLGRYRAADGSAGAPVEVDLDRPHATLVVGKRGYGKSYTLGVLAEACALAPGVAPVVVDPVGALAGTAGGDVPGRVLAPRVRADAVPARAWPDLLGLDPGGGAGALVWRAADAAGSLAEMRERVADASAGEAARRAAANHLRLAASWGVFDPDAPGPAGLADDGVTVLDCAGLDPAPAAAVVRAEWKRFFEQEGLSLEVELALAVSDDNQAAIELLATDLTGRANAGELESSGPDRDPRSYPAALGYDDDDG